MDRDDELDNIIANLPADYEYQLRPATKPKPVPGRTENANQTHRDRYVIDDDEIDAIIANLPPDFEHRARPATKPKPPKSRKRTSGSINENDEAPKRARRTRTCSECESEITENHMAQHKLKHSDTCYVCPHHGCNYSGRYPGYMRKHIQRQHADQDHYCPKCHTHFEDIASFLKEPHFSNCIKQCRPDEPTPVEPQPTAAPNFHEDPENPPANFDHPFWADPHLRSWIGYEPAVSEIRRLWRTYRQRFHTSSRLIMEFNFRTTGTDVQNFNIENAMAFIYARVNTVFTFNIGITTLLRRDLPDGTHEFRVFAAQNNRQNLFARNLLVHNLASLRAAIEEFGDLPDLVNFIERPNTEWKVVAILGLSFYIYARPSFVAGKGSSRLPKFLTLNTKNLLAMERNKDQNLITDNMCLFRCLLAAKSEDYFNMEKVISSFKTYRDKVKRNHDWKNFNGVPEADIPILEDLYKVNINIYRKSTPKAAVQCLRLGAHIDWPVVNVHSYRTDAGTAHFSLITNLDGFAKRFQCTTCDKFFKTSKHLQEHMTEACNGGKSKKSYPGDCYESAPTVWDNLMEFGIHVEKERRRTTGIIAWDIEACLEPCNDLKYKRKDTEMDEAIEQTLNDQNILVEYYPDAPGQQIRERHKIATAAIISTVPGYEEVAFLEDKDPDLLVTEILQKMLDISEANYELEKEKFADVYGQLAVLRSQAEEAVEGASKDDKKFRERAALKKVKKLEKQFDQHCKQTIVIHFNGGRYDLNVVKKHLFGKLVEKVRNARTDASTREEFQPWPKSIARGNTIMCLATEELKFIDIIMFTGPGTSLDSFIKAYCPEGLQKLPYPYELLRSHDDLRDIVEFPEKSKFFSTLKNKGISDEEYQNAKAVWDGLAEKNLLEYTRVYNSIDVIPFLNAAQRLSAIFYDDMGIDIYKECLSLPGVTSKVLFQGFHRNHPTATFGLFGEKQADLCQQLYSSMCGGLAKIVQRRAIVNETPIRNDPNTLVQSIIGYDFNALYLWALAQPMPTGYVTEWALNEDSNQFERKSETQEEILKKRKVHGETSYLKFCSFRDNLYIHTAVHGRQATLGIPQYRVDGLAKDATPRPKVYEYRGCRYHFHTQAQGCLNKKLDLSEANPGILELDKEKEKAIKELGFDLEIRYECEFAKIKRLAKNLSQSKPPCFDASPAEIHEARKYNEFLRAHPTRAFHKNQTVSYLDMKQAILNGDVFGFCLVDVETKAELKELHSDFPCVIKHASISRNDIGEIMKKMAEELGLLEKPRDCLISSYHGTGLWLMTPYVKWLHEHGVVLKRVTRVAQYDSEVTFSWFKDIVTTMRMRGDADKALQLMSDLYKLLGNAGYGKPLTRLDRHRDTFYCDEAECADEMNEPLFHQAKQISPDCYEVTKHKKTINYNLPLQIGLSVYSYAKLRLLSFIHDVLQVYVPKEKYDFLETDTDSIYLALATKTLKEAVPVNKLAAFEQIEKDWFVMDPSQKRVPGLLKVEKTGSAYIGLCAKTYIVVPEQQDAGIKVASKGIQQARNAAILNFANFDRVLNSDPNARTVAFNAGIREMGGNVVTYIAARAGLTAFYCKRKTVENNRTLPLDI